MKISIGIPGIWNAVAGAIITTCITFLYYKKLGSLAVQQEWAKYLHDPASLVNVAPFCVGVSMALGWLLWPVGLLVPLGAYGLVALVSYLAPNMASDDLAKFTTYFFAPMFLAGILSLLFGVIGKKR